MPNSYANIYESSSSITDTRGRILGEESINVFLLLDEETDKPLEVHLEDELKYRNKGNDDYIVTNMVWIPYASFVSIVNKLKSLGLLDG